MKMIQHLGNDKLRALYKTTNPNLNIPHIFT
jgi:hypothetical protein